MSHRGEEPAISGTQGSGTIFFSYCNMACVYCQNYEFSQKGEGREADFQELAQFMLALQRLGCHNINLVTPTHVMPQILKSLRIAINKGLNLPLVYNTGGYELPQIIKLLDGIIDIYLPDMRYADNKQANSYSSAIDYPKYNQKSVKQMYEQVGPAKMDAKGIITKGLIIRHLVLPNDIAGTEKIMEFISQNLSRDTYISLMSQYQPCYLADQSAGFLRSSPIGRPEARRGEGSLGELSRRITYEEYEFAQTTMQKSGLHNGWVQESRGLKRFLGTNIKPNV
jgi:putative pyruvate formate lyase activating enzyme